MVKKEDRVATGLPTYAYLIIDLVSFFLSVGPGAFAFTVAAIYLRHFWPSRYFPLYALLTVFPLVLSFLITLFIFRLLVPRLKKGVYPMAVNLGMFSWYCNLALSRASAVC
ncbi:MAG: hypothetical protein ACXVBE_15455, partial [Bdellovibrionota bacterium]